MVPHNAKNVAPIWYTKSGDAPKGEGKDILPTFYTTLLARTHLHILFGEDHDKRHIDPDAPGAYEWWYFDALSDNGQWALVAIYFIGSPMSPYYKASASGSGAIPAAREWCGVFFALHEKPPRQSRWVERAYAYNLYKGGQWSDTNALPQVRIGGSEFSAASAANVGGVTWRVNLKEPGLWRGEVRADLAFAQIPTRFPDAPPLTGDDTHTWVCAAPLCDMEGTVTVSHGETISFVGSGYHDHNFGRLPLQTTDIWYWGRAPLQCDDHKTRQAVFYHLVNKPAPGEEYAEAETTWLAFEEAEAKNQPAPLVRENLPLLTDPTRNKFGLKHYDRVILAHNVLGDNEQWRVALRPEQGTFSEGPFYRRLPITVSAQQQTQGQTAWTGKGEGIAEVFRPSRMLGPIASRAMWSRLRKRST